MTQKLVIEVDEQACGGCRLCELVCGLYHEGVVNIEKSRIRVIDDFDHSRSIPGICQLCEQPRCVASCRAEALTQDAETGIITVDNELCDGCQERANIFPCQAACPIHMDVQGYLALVSVGKLREAYRLLRDTNPLPAICGYVCQHPCEDVCNRRHVDEPLAIADIKRFITDQSDIDEFEYPPFVKSGKRVAVVGSGPAGLTAAYYLAKQGHLVTIFEAASKPGGMMRFGVPRFMLPEDVLERDIDSILRLDVELKLNSPVRKVDDILMNGYDAVFLAVGLGRGRQLALPGTDLEGVLIGLPFLKDVNESNEVKLGGRVAVVGGGGVACDVARAARRLGAAEVYMVCLESRDTMPAYSGEIEAVEAKGITIYPSRTLTRILGDDGHVGGVECLNLKWMEFDAEGELHLEAIDGSEHVLEADTVIFAVGQALDDTLDLDGGGIDVSKRGTIVVDSGTLETEKRGVFAGGDAVTGPASVVEAIAAGKQAARSIDSYLNGEPLAVEEKWQAPQEPSAQEIATLKQRFPAQARGKMAEMPLARRISSFGRVKQGYTNDEAKQEALRCMACGPCWEACPNNAIWWKPRLERLLVCDRCGGEPVCLDFCGVGALRLAETSRQRDAG